MILDSSKLNDFSDKNIKSLHQFLFGASRKQNRYLHSLKQEIVEINSNKTVNPIQNQERKLSKDDIIHCLSLFGLEYDDSKSKNFNLQQIIQKIYSTTTNEDSKRSMKSLVSNFSNAKHPSISSDSLTKGIRQLFQSGGKFSGQEFQTYEEVKIALNRELNQNFVSFQVYKPLFEKNCYKMTSSKTVLLLLVIL